MVAKENAISSAQFLLALAKHHNPHEPDEGDQFYSAATKQGFLFCGSGHFSYVFKHVGAPGYVIKVTIRDNDSAPAYMAWCRAHPGPHVPVIHHLQRSGRFVVAVLDELFDMDKDRQDIYELYLDRYLEKVNDHPANKVAQTIAKFFKGVAEFDLHCDNVMMTKNGHLVLTDPLAFSDTKESRALRTGIERAFDIAA